MIEIDSPYGAQRMQWIPPWWWRTPEEQMKRAWEFWPDIRLPAPPFGFVPQSRTGVLLLHVPRPFDELWSMVDAPTGYVTRQWTYFRSDKQHLRLHPLAVAYAGPAWIELDPEYGRGAESSQQLWVGSGVSPAAHEVASMLMQFSGWPLAWCAGASAPNFSGFRYFHKGGTFVPFLNRWQGISQVKLHVLRAGISHTRWAWPSVRGVSSR